MIIFKRSIFLECLSLPLMLICDSAAQQPPIPVILLQNKAPQFDQKVLMNGVEIDVKIQCTLNLDPQQKIIKSDLKFTAVDKGKIIINDSLNSTYNATTSEKGNVSVTNFIGTSLKGGDDWLITSRRSSQGRGDDDAKTVDLWAIIVRGDTKNVESIDDPDVYDPTKNFIIKNEENRTILIVWLGSVSAAD